MTRWSPSRPTEVPGSARPDGRRALHVMFVECVLRSQIDERCGVRNLHLRRQPAKGFPETVRRPEIAPAAFGNGEDAQRLGMLLQKILREIDVRQSIVHVDQ